MYFNDERRRTHYGYWYRQVAVSYFRRLPARQIAALEPITLHLHDPDAEVEAIHHQHLLYTGQAVDGTQLVLYPQRIEESTAGDTSRYDLTISCLTKATNDLSPWKSPKSPPSQRLTA